MSRSVRIGTPSLTVDDVCRVAVEREKVELPKEAVARIKKCRQTVEEILSDGESVHYGINTGFGSLKGTRIDADRLDQHQLNFLRSHAAGSGRPFPRPVVRAIMLLRAHTLALGHSGVRPEIVAQLVALLNADVVPVIPEQGSVGASGDLAPLAHLALVLVGEGEVLREGKPYPAVAELKNAGIKPLHLKAKEGLSLVNGTQMMTAVGTLGLRRAEIALQNADVAAAMTLEGVEGTHRAYDERIHALRPHPGQSAVAFNLRQLTEGSEIYESHRDCDEVQDAYSLRCVPQVHGTARDALTYVKNVLEREANSVTDNPIVFPETGEAVSAGNFHGQPVAFALDAMAVALTSVGSMSERRMFRLLNPGLSRLPAGLTNDAGFHSGLMMLQVTAASLVNECKTLSHPASVDSIPTWADQEDHVSMGAFSARKSAMVVEALEKIVALELLCAAQSLEFRKPLSPAPGVKAAYERLRKDISMVESDRVLSPDIERSVGLVRSGTLIDAASKAVGKMK